MKKQEKVVFLSGKKVNLRPLDQEKDLEKLLVWINDQEVNEFMSRFLPLSRSEEKEWLSKKRENDVILAIETKQGLFIGTIGLHQIDYRNGRTELGIMIGNKNYWSKGYGFDAEMILLNYAFATLNMYKVIHPAFLENRRSIGCAKKCGGIKEGIMHKHFFKRNQRHDMIVLAIFKNRWQKIWQKCYQKGGK